MAIAPPPSVARQYMIVQLSNTTFPPVWVTAPPWIAVPLIMVQLDITTLPPTVVSAAPLPETKLVIRESEMRAIARESPTVIAPYEPESIWSSQLPLAIVNLPFQMVTKAPHAADALTILLPFRMKWPPINMTAPLLSFAAAFSMELPASSVTLPSRMKKAPPLSFAVQFTILHPVNSRTPPNSEVTPPIVGE
eukprot:2738507-Prymnesium_polylepis.1